MLQREVFQLLVFCRGLSLTYLFVTVKVRSGWSETVHRLNVMSLISSAFFLVLGIAAPKTWPSLQQKPSPLTVSCPSTKSSGRTSVPSFVPWGFLLLPIPDWRADAHSPTLSGTESSHRLQKTLRLDGLAQLPIIWLILITLCVWIFFIFTRSLVGSVTQYEKFFRCWNSSPSPVFLSMRV